jgi:prepilin-type N-terminal cleavage/methylation domain-containing protein
MTRRIAAERGFTLTELMVTCVIVAAGLIGLVSTLDHSRDLVSLSEKMETANHQAELEIERLLSIPYATLSLRAAPANSPNTSDPDFYVTNGPPARYQWDQQGAGQTSDLVVDTVNGAINTSTITWTDNSSRLSGEIARYVTWTGDLCNEASCEPAEQRAKRITVAVTVNGPKAPRRPIVISTIKSDPVTTG